jgi:hypothetical protein
MNTGRTLEEACFGFAGSCLCRLNTTVGPLGFERFVVVNRFAA